MLTIIFNNPIDNSINTININYPEIDYIKWKRKIDYNNDIDICNILNNILNNLDCTKEFECGRPMMTIYFAYKDTLQEYYYYLVKLNNQIIYNTYLDKLIKRHIDNIQFEYSNPLPVKSKSKRSKRAKAMPDKFIKYKSKDLFTGKDVYFYENEHRGDVIKSDNPNLKDILNKSKKKVKHIGVPMEAMTFNFKKK